MNRNLKDVSVRLKVDPVRFPLLMKEGIEGRLETAGNLSNLPLTPSFIRRGNSNRPFNLWSADTAVCSASGSLALDSPFYNLQIRERKRA